MSPSTLALLPDEELSDLTTLMSGGESCTPEVVNRWSSGRRFCNLYGPTEATIIASRYVVDQASPQVTSIPIGRPLGNTQLYILDANLQPLPIGVPGELHIGGVGIARGYLNRPELTDDRFIADPFSSEPRARLYKSGDLARYLPDGNIEFLGRIDHQVKIRGFRIELGEIEAVLRQHPALEEAVVLARQDTTADPSAAPTTAKRLVAYVVPAHDEVPNVTQLRDFLKQKLPDYMLPSAFFTLETLPLTASGKIDRRALPAPDATRPSLERQYVAPRTPTEEVLATTCAELLGVDKVGIHDSFFDLGGHSLLATQLISRLRDTFEIELPLRSVFEHPSIAELSVAIEQAREKGVAPEAPPLVPLSRELHRVKRSSLSASDIPELETERKADE
jgi:acyl carrier protein